MAIVTAYKDFRHFDYTPSSAVSAGAIVIQGSLVGYARLDIAADTLGTLWTEGQADITKEATTDTYAVGDDVFYDSGNSRATPNPTAYYLGKCLVAAAATDTTVKVLLDLNSNPVPKAIEETFSLGDMTDNGDATGYIDLAVQLPIGSRVVGWSANTTAGWVGDTTAVIQVGDTSDLDRFSAVTTGSVLGVALVGSQENASANAFNAVATTVRVTITGGADFGSITAGTTEIKVFYLPFS